MNRGYSDNDIRNNLVEYIEETEKLMDMINNKLDSEEVRDRYKELKRKVKDEAHRTSLSINRNNASKFEKQYYEPAISEASAWGFTVSTNSRVDNNMYNAIEEAHYKLTKHLSLEELKEYKFNV